MDKDKRRHVVAGVKGAWMPAWPANGTRIAFLQETTRKKYRLMSADITRGR